MNRHIVYAIIIATALSACGHGARHDAASQRQRQFVDIVRLPSTPVKDQGRAATCWIYAMLATMETDRIGMDDSLNLSADYAARAWMLSQASRYYLSRGKHGISMRGMATTLLHIADEQGLMPYDSYYAKEPANYGVLARRVEHMAPQSATFSSYMQSATAAMDDAIGYLPLHVFMLGATYTPQEFAHSVAHASDYEALTSFTHHPFGAPFVLETPDNAMADAFMNVSIDSLVARINQALSHGYAVCWEGDISERGFSFERGVATIDDAQPCTQDERQRQFERLRTTDDHCMAIIGKARDRQGQTFYIAKNSWGRGNPYGGMMYMSEKYLRMKTIAIVTRRLAQHQQQ